MYEQPSPSTRAAVAAIGVLVALTATALFLVVTLTVTSSTIPFDNDEANHAVDGWEVYHALVNRTPGDLYRSITGQGFYPPVHSFFVAAAYLIAGPSLASSRIPTAVNFALTLLLLAWLTFRISRQRPSDDLSDVWLPLAGAAFAVSLAITSEVFVVNAVLTMTEMTGAMLALLLLLVVDRISESRVACRRSVRWIGLSVAAIIAMLIFLTKYSFGIFYLPALIAALVTATKPWKAGRHAWLEAAAVIAVYAVLIGIWIYVTDRETMRLFFIDHPQNAPILSTRNLFFLPRVWFEHYSTSGVIAVIGVSLALLGAVLRWQRPSVRVASWSILTAIVVLTISPTDQPRHFLPVAPAVWMLAALGLVEVLRRLQRRPDGAVGIIAALLAVWALLIGGAVKPAGSLRARLVKELEGLPIYAEMQDFALQHVDLDRPILYIGEPNDSNGILAVRWRAATLTNKSLWDLNIDYFPFKTSEHSLHRTHRKPQIATVDPAFPTKPLDEVLDRNYYAYVIEFKLPTSDSAARSGNFKNPMSTYPAITRRFDDWIATVYQVSPDRKANTAP